MLTEEERKVINRLLERYVKPPSDIGDNMTVEFAIELAERDREIERLQGEIERLQRTFDLRWAAQQRAIKRWQEAHPGNDMTWPDHADLIVWLMDEVERLVVDATA